MFDDDFTEKTETRARILNTSMAVLAFGAFLILSIVFPNLVWPFLLGLCAVLYAIWQFGNPEIKPSLVRHVKPLTERSVSSSLASLAQAMQYPIYIVDEKADVMFANTATHTVFGEIKTGDRIFIRFRQPDLKVAIERAMQNNEPEKIEYNEIIPDDRWFTVEISPILSRLGKSKNDQSLFIIGFHELTETKRIDQMRSDFIANASHELRTPLASLLGYIETLKGSAKNDPKAQERFLDTMLDQAERMSRLVNDLLSLSKIEMKSHVRPSEVVDLTEVIKSVVNSLERLASQMAVKIELEAPEKFMINGDRDELVQVFENLIENGCKYGQDGERVIVKIFLDNPQEVVVSVRDFGPGIAGEHQHRITERFYRVDVARSREKQGTGLGLAIVKHILQRHGSRLVVNSSIGDGAEFSVKFDLIKVEKTN